MNKNWDTLKQSGISTQSDESTQVAIYISIYIDLDEKTGEVWSGRTWLPAVTHMESNLIQKERPRQEWKFIGISSWIK